MTHITLDNQLQYAPSDRAHLQFYSLKADFSSWISHSFMNFQACRQVHLLTCLFSSIYYDFRIFQALKAFVLRLQRHRLAVEIETSQRNGILAIYNSHVTQDPQLCMWISQKGSLLTVKDFHKAEITGQTVGLLIPVKRRYRNVEI